MTFGGGTRQLLNLAMQGGEGCASEDCSIAITTGLHVWSGAAYLPTLGSSRVVPDEGHWLGTARSSGALTLSTNFEVGEPSCAWFDLAFTADDNLIHVELNGQVIDVPPHERSRLTHRPGLLAPRGQGLFWTGTNTLVVSVASGPVATGVYIQGHIQLLCPLAEATLRVQPSNGPINGGTLVEVTSNVNLYHGCAATCVFGRQAVVASSAGASAVQCRTPSKAAQTWSTVELHTELQGSARTGSLRQARAARFYFYSGPLVSSVGPALGPVRGGTLVKVAGRFETMLGLRCRFGRGSLPMVAPSTVDPSYLDCTSPAQHESGLVRVYVSGNGQQFVSGPGFQYVRTLRILRVTPRRVLSEGGMMLTVHTDGSHEYFGARGPPFCLIGWANTPASVDGRSLLCRAPSAEPGFAAVEVSTNGNDYTVQGHHIEFVLSKLLRVEPTSGPRRGATTVTVTGQEMLAGARCTCGFDGVQSPTSEASEGGESVVCIQPALGGSGWVGVKIAFDGVAVHSTLQFFVYADVACSTLAPPLGPSRTQKATPRSPRSSCTTMQCASGAPRVACETSKTLPTSPPQEI